MRNHSWYFDFAQNELGDIVYVTLPEVGQEFEKGAAVEVEATKTVADAYAPMDCTITAVNSQLETELRPSIMIHAVMGGCLKQK